MTADQFAKEVCVHLGTVVARAFLTSAVVLLVVLSLPALFLALGFFGGNPDVFPIAQSMWNQIGRSWFVLTPFLLAATYFLLGAIVEENRFHQALSGGMIVVLVAVGQLI